MKYKNIKKAVFCERPNRFIAICKIDGKAVTCHVKNTGRCKELLVPGATVYLEESERRERKTKYDLISVIKGAWLFNIDAIAPNIVFGEFLSSGGLLSDISLIKPECKYKNSRFDFYVEHGGKAAFLEVKGVTLEEDNVLMFPDAPTERGIKHIYELCDTLENGYEAYIVFVAATERGKYFTPNRRTHKEFADALFYAEAKGVKILCLGCKLSENSIEINRYIDVKLK